MEAIEFKTFATNGVPIDLVLQWQTISVKQGLHIADDYRWIEIIENCFKKKVKITCLVDERNNLLAICSWVLTSRILGKKTLVVGPYGGLGGLISNEESQGLLMEELTRIAAKSKAALVVRSQIFSTSLPDIVSEELVYFEKKIGSENLIEKMNKKVRYEVKRSHEKEVKSSCSYQREDLDEFSRFFTKSFRQLGTPFPGEKYIRNLIRVFDENLMMIQLRDAGHELVGLAIVIRTSDNRSHVLHANINESGQKVSAGYRLYFEIMRISQQQGIEVVNFGRSIRGSTQADFKRKWRMEEKPINFLRTQNSSPVFFYCRDNLLSTLVTKVWRALPIHLVVVIGPRVARGIM
jgi:hypothetical protein